MIIVFLVLLCFFSVHQLNAVIIELPPKTPAFTTEFRFHEAEEGKNRVSVTVHDGTDLKLMAKNIMSAVFGESRPELEKRVIEMLIEKASVYNVEQRNADLLPSGTLRPLFSVPITTTNAITTTESLIHFYPDDSPQFAFRRFLHQNGLAIENLDFRESLLKVLHQKRLVQTKQTCLQNKKCLVDHCLRHKPIFPGYELQKPSNLKDAILLSYAYRHRVEDCVETGTYQGTTTLLLAKAVCSRNVVTIELSPTFAKKAQSRFEKEIKDGNMAAKKITLLEGDSGDVLYKNQIFTQLRKTLWFLDGHYSYLDTARGKDDSPLMRELEFVLTRGGHNNVQNDDIILVDDAREFRGKRFPNSSGNKSIPLLQYPELSSVIDKVCELAPEAFVDLVDDILIIQHVGTTVAVL
jgi:hypothetical protein